VPILKPTARCHTPHKPTTRRPPNPCTSQTQREAAREPGCQPSRPASDAQGTDHAGSSEVGTCKGRPFGAAYGGACRPDLDRTRPLRFSALTSAGKSLPNIGQPRFLKGSPDMRATPTLRTRPHTTTPAPANTARRRGQVRRAAAELTPHAIEQIAQRVAQILHERRHEQADARRTPARLLDATQLARHLGVTRTWVYEHAPAARRDPPRHRLQGPPTVRPRHRDRCDQEPARANARRCHPGHRDVPPRPSPPAAPARGTAAAHPRAQGTRDTRPARPYRKGAIAWHAKQQDRSLRATASAA
jgi:hypothetical protein